MEKHLECMDHHEDVCSRIWISTNSTKMILLLTVQGMQAQKISQSTQILTLWFIIYIYIYMYVIIKHIISMHSFVLTTTNSPPSTYLPTQKNKDDNPPNFPTYCSKLLILTDRLLSKTGSTFYDFSLKPSTHWESREPLNWVTSHLRMFWCQPFCSHDAEQKVAIQKSLLTSVGSYDSKW